MKELAAKEQGYISKTNKENREMISVLFAEKEGIYSTFSDIDIWDIERNATMFKESNSVICHPPCQLWGKFAKINYKRWGGEHNKPKNDGGLFKFALDKVRSNCGVLEHPAQSYAFQEYDIPKPVFGKWTYIGNDEFITEIWQSAYGHLANKKTWLFYKGKTPHQLKWKKVIGSHQIGFHDQRGKVKNKPTISGKKASSTPYEFAIELIKLAENSK